MRACKIVLVAVALALIPVAAQAHAFSGTGSWLDELICLVPASIMVILVFMLGRDPKSRGSKKDKP